jgi:hypothetical protein
MTLPTINKELFEAKSASIRGAAEYQMRLIATLYDEQPALAGMIEILLQDDAMGNEDYRSGYITGILSTFDLFSTQVECNSMEVDE